MVHNKDVPNDYDTVEPNPAALIESLRAFGYSPEAAIADLLDNSITAGATEIHIAFRWRGVDSSISITDNGKGMDESTLINSMRIGSRSPRDIRAANDLGRFGLGLKTASFSQCRALTVVSKTISTETTMRKWDLDEVESSMQWRLLHTGSPAALNDANSLASLGSGTVVVWENLDRLIDTSNPDDESSEKNFYNSADAISAHLSMTFHRLIGRGLKILVNEVEIRKWDPFLEGNPSRQVLGTEKIELDGSNITIDSFVMPHRSKLSQEDYELAGGTRGWNDLQGFYVYRNNRLLVAGDWLGLKVTKEEHYKLARIRINIANDLDDQWQIDVRKSVAVPPFVIRGELKRIAQYTRQRATEVYRHRGKVLATQASRGVINVWEQRIKNGRIFYKINEKHVAVQTAVTEPSAKNIRMLLRIIEETIPVPLITIAASENPESHSAPLELATPKQVTELAIDLLTALGARGLAPDLAVERVLNTEPFNLYPELLEMLTKESGRNDK
jgi:hypothetical protein